MDDFLHKLRNASKRTGFDRNRRGQDNYSPRGDRNKSKAKRAPQSVSVGYDHLAAIRRTLETIAENQKKLMDAERLRREIEERKAQALENIAGLLGRSGQVHTSPPADEKEPETLQAVGGETQASVAGRADRDKILKIIHGLREEGQTYEHIARHLETQKIPTLSGRGKWRGQTIYRLYKETV